MPNLSNVSIEAGFLGCSDQRSFKGNRGDDIPIFTVSFVLSGYPVKFNIMGHDAVEKLFSVCSSLKYGDWCELIMQPHVKEEKLNLKLNNVLLCVTT